MSAFLFRRPAGLALFVLFVLTFPPSAGPSEAQGIDDLNRTGRAGYAACRHKLAQMIDEALYYDRMKADLPGMEAHAAELQAKLDTLNAKHGESSKRLALLETEHRTLTADLPKAETECREAWLPSLSGACSRLDRMTRRLGEEVNPELSRLRAELPPLAQQRQETEDTLSVLQMNLQSRRNYVAREARPAEAEIAEQQERCRALEPAAGREPDSSGSALVIDASAAQGFAGEEITLRARLVSPVPEAQYGFVWSVNGRVFGGNGDRAKVTIPGEGTNTVRVAAWRWEGRQWLKTAEASRCITGGPRVQQRVSISGPAALALRNGAARGSFEARIAPEAPGEMYGFTWGAVGDPQGPVTFTNQSSSQSLTVTTPGRYAVLVHAWKLVNGQWVLIGKASHPFTVQ